MSFRVVDSPERPGRIPEKGTTPFGAARAALTFPLRFLCNLAEEAEGCEAQITYYAHRVTNRRAA